MRSRPTRGAQGIIDHSPDPRRRQPEFAYVSAIEEGVREAAQIGPHQGLSPDRHAGDILKRELQQSGFCPAHAEDGRIRGFQEGLPGRPAPSCSCPHVPDRDHAKRIPGGDHSRPPHEEVPDPNVVAKDKITVIEANAPLTRMFGYSTDIRSLSQGRASFTMYFSHYDRVENE